jgi:hypothetical protein
MMHTGVRKTAWLALGALLVIPSLLVAAPERAGTESILQRLEAQTATKAVTADAVARARNALDRAARLRSQGDETHARMLEGVARQWADGAGDLVDATLAERQADDAQREALDAGARIERERASLEEGIARSGQLRVQLEQLEHEGKLRPERTAAVGSTAVDAGARSDAGGPVAPPGARLTDPRGAGRNIDAGSGRVPADEARP